jgi:hypothetical protein
VTLCLQGPTLDGNNAIASWARHFWTSTGLYQVLPRLAKFSVHGGYGKHERIDNSPELQIHAENCAEDSHGIPNHVQCFPQVLKIIAAFATVIAESAPERALAAYAKGGTFDTTGDMVDWVSSTSW